ncbi:MAG: hypothetical protein ACXV3T_02225 [Halobacteriota archaeon]
MSPYTAMVIHPILPPGSYPTVMCTIGVCLLCSRARKKAHLNVLVAALSQGEGSTTQQAEEELLYWCISGKDALESLKKTEV